LMPSKLRVPSRTVVGAPRLRSSRTLSAMAKRECDLALHFVPRCFWD
jgi:hypothetical protein